jgi:DNA-binding LacI/PurR family transcriptional regulator
VLNKSSSPNKSTRYRVLAAPEAQDYVKNPSACALATKLTRTIYSNYLYLFYLGT